MEFDIHPAAELGLQIWAWLAGIWLVLLVIGRLTRANTVIETAKHLPGGLHYQTPEEFDEENEELGYRAHA